MLEKELEKEVVKEKEVKPNYSIDNRWLKIFVNQEEQKYYIDVFAASELHLYSYEEACRDYARGNNLFLLTEKQLHLLQERFKNRIQYSYFNKEDIQELSNIVYSNYYDYLGYNDYRNYINNPNEIDSFDDEIFNNNVM